MRPKSIARSALRSATAAWHDRVDAIFSTVDLADRGDYGRFLLAQGEALFAVEDALTRASAAAILPDWAERQRAGLLRDDLAALDLAPPAAIEAPAFASPAAALGGVYVLEGSRLGGRMLRRSVPPHLPSSFLAGGDPAAWRRLLDILDERLADEGDRQTAIEAASAVFRLFEQSGRRHLVAE